MNVIVDGWFEERHGGVSCRFACIQYEHFGFAITQQEAEVFLRKLKVLLETGECETDDASLLCVDWSQAGGDWVMIAFRPGEHCRGRFYDIPKEAAIELREKLTQLIEK